MCFVLVISGAETPFFSQSKQTSVLWLVQYSRSQPGQATLRNELFFRSLGRISGGKLAKGFLIQLHCFSSVTRASLFSFNLRGLRATCGCPPLFWPGFGNPGQAKPNLLGIGNSVAFWFHDTQAYFYSAFYVSPASRSAPTRLSLLGASPTNLTKSPTTRAGALPMAYSACSSRRSYT